MCGIFGIIATGASWQEKGISISPSQATHALMLMHHRGPNHSALTWFSKDSEPQTQTIQANQAKDTKNTFEQAPASLVLGHNRLSIIDRTAHANQPMSYQGFWIVYNGEIYNYRELRNELQAKGHHFQTQSDTEVLLALYAECGMELVHRLNGMFAFALWDPRQQRLFLARDRYGIKPLYYTRLQDGAFAFASEFKSLLALPGVSKALNCQALSEHFTFQNMYEGRTLLQDIHSLEPGHDACLEPTSGALNIETYWEPRIEPNACYTEQSLPQTIDTVRQTFERAVQRQWVGDVPIGSFLSGGLDTGAITAITSQQHPGLHTFTAGFETQGLSGDERAFDERHAARELAQQLGTQHHELTIPEHAFSSILPQVVWHLDDFRAGISYQNYLVSDMVKDFTTVVLSGVGGDELLAGYPWRYETLLDLPAPANYQLSQQYYQRWVRLLSEREKQSAFTPEVLRALSGFNTYDSFQRVFNSGQASTPLDKALCFDFKTFLPALLTVEDRLSMAHHLESRVPFLDNDFVDLCLQLPSHFKLRPTRHNTSPANGPVSKWILREALKGILPDDVLTRRKQGFTPPDASWYRTRSAQAQIEALLLSPSAQARGLFQPTAIRQLLSQHFEGHRNHRFLIWSLMCLEWWFRQFIDPPTPTPYQAA